MRTARGLSALLAALTGLALLVAGPIMVARGFDGQHQVKNQLTAQKIVFPQTAKEGLPANLAGYAGQQVRTGTQAKAYADMVETHVLEATKGQTYSQVSDAYRATNSTDPKLGALRQTAFMGESLRGSLMGAYQAWELTWLVIGLGALFIGTGLVTTFAGVISLLTWRRNRIKVPHTPASLIEQPHPTQA
ncbi:MAG: hypothetical protein ACJ73S_15950 [Mycobacteriales bacterium]